MRQIQGRQPSAPRARLRAAGLSVVLAMVVVGLSPLAATPAQAVGADEACDLYADSRVESSGDGTSPATAFKTATELVLAIHALGNAVNDPPSTDVGCLHPDAVFED